MAIKYSEKVIEHFTSPQNVGDLKDANAVATEGSPACGDMVTFALQINPNTQIIEDIRFRSFGCASNIATASMATLIAKGKSIEDVKRLTHKNITDALDGLPAIKLHCSVLAIDGLKAAVHKWEVDHGLRKIVTQVLDPSSVTAALSTVINPRTGEFLHDVGMFGRIEIEPDDERVYVEVKIKEVDERFAENIEGEVREKLEAIPGVMKVIVQFKIKSTEY